MCARGFAVAAGILGEGVRHPDEAREAARAYCELLEAFAREGLDANVAFKLTHMGLEIDPELAFENALSIARTAQRCANTMRLDMEQSAHCDATIAIYRRLRAQYAGAGLVLQSYLYRSEADLRSVLDLEPNLRIVKGAYLEPPALAYPDKKDVDANYLRLAEIALSHPGYTAIASHDERIVDAVCALAQKLQLPKRGRFEFQLLYGIGQPLADRLLREGYRVRIAVPFGSHWFPYLMRRLAERPANLAFFLKGAFARG